MTNNIRLPQSSRIHRLQRGLLAAMAVLLIALPVASNAQEISTVVRGTVTTPDGGPAVGELITVTDSRTARRQTTTTDANGKFTVRGLSVGGPYTIRVDSSQYEDTLVTDVYTNLSGATNFDIVLAAANAQFEEIVVTAKMVQSAPMAIGPGSSFSLDDIESMPSIGRQIRDVIRIDPRVSIARAAGGDGSGINCLGGTSRSNVMTIDGAVASDGYGLNEGTGTSARFAFPIPFDTIASTSVEFAPLDVQYSQFTGCAINVVTKPGSNEFHGDLVYLYNDESMTGDKLPGGPLTTDPFEDTNWGFGFSGPIIKDKLFFHVAYEETDEAGTQNSGPIGAGFANEDWLTEAEANEIADIMRDQYGRDPGALVRVLPQFSERTYVRLDWNINDDHRAEMSYTKLEESKLEGDGIGFDGFTFEDNFQITGIEQDTISLRLFSNWTDNFSTEFRYSSFDVQDFQGPALGGEAQDANPKPRLAVGDGTLNFGNPNIVFTSGPGEFRSANDLQYTIDQIKLSADYVLNDHTLTFGVEQETRDVFNLFISDGTGTITFVDQAALEAGTADSIDFNGSFTQDPRDAGATFERDVNSIYLQDEWLVNDALTVIVGLRYDEYKTSDVPIENSDYLLRYGFSNATSFDGLDLVQPRLGFTYDLPTSKWGSTQMSLGFGVFGGGDPTVHFANSYQNFGGAIGPGSDGSPACAANPDVLQVTDGNGQFTGLPACISQGAADAANALQGTVAAIDPNFELPSNQRWSFGLRHMMETNNSFFNGWEIQADYIYTDHKDAPHWVDLRISPNGVTMPDGRPQFFEVDPLRAGCNATFNGIGQGFSNAGTNGGPCDGNLDPVTDENQAPLLTNGVEGSTKSFSIQFAKDFEFSDRTSLMIGLGYAHLDSQTGNPVNSSTAWSSYEEVAVEQLNVVGLAPSVWGNEHNIVLRARFRHEWADGYPFSVGMFFQRRSGRPFSYAYEDDTGEDYFGDSDDESRILVHVPTGPADPLYDFSTCCADENDPDDAGDVAALFAFLERTGLSAYAGGIAPRNAFNSPWSSDLDIRIEQDFPVWSDHSLKVYLDIENVLNLFSSSGNLKQYAHVDDVEEAARVLEVLGDVNNTDQFVVNDWYEEGHNWNRDVDDSVYRIQLGVRYRF
jgi:hypothetical protein